MHNMEKKDDISQLFERLEGSFDVHETPEGHQKRFLDKLQHQPKAHSKKTHILWKVASVAAAVALLLYLGSVGMAEQTPKEADLASVSPEMEQTQSFFTTTINREIQVLMKSESPENTKIIEGALTEIEKLETEYQQLKKDLVLSGNNKRVIHAMITNFQNRIAILEQVSATIESITIFKQNTYETLL